MHLLNNGSNGKIVAKESTADGICEHQETWRNQKEAGNVELKLGTAYKFKIRTVVDVDCIADGIDEVILIDCHRGIEPAQVGPPGAELPGALIDCAVLVYIVNCYL